MTMHSCSTVVLVLVLLSLCAYTFALLFLKWKQIRKRKLEDGYKTYYLWFVKFDSTCGCTKPMGCEVLFDMWTKLNYNHIG